LFFFGGSCKNLNNFQKSNIEEKWGILLRSKSIEEIKIKYEKLKMEDKMIFKNILIKLKEIINNSDNINDFDTEIFNLEPDYSWAAKIRYACILAKEKLKWFKKPFMKFKNKNEAIQGFQNVKEKINIFINDLSAQSSLNKLAFSFFEKNKEKIKDGNFKTEIEIQNENRKNFLETLKNLIDNNIETIQKYINENKTDNTIETDKLLSIEDIIKTTTSISLDFKTDIKSYMNEFGFITFEVLIIKKRKFYIGNLIIIALGILEFALGAALLAYSSNPKIFQIACYFIREGIKDVIKGVKACIDGEEINLKNYAIEKGISLVGFALELVIGKTTTIGNTFKEKFITAIKGQCISLAKNYGNRYLANKIVKKLIHKMSGKIKGWLISPLMDLIKLNDENIDKYIQYDIINNSDEFQGELIKQCENILDQSDYLIDFIGPIIEVIKIFNNKEEKGKRLTNFLEYMSNFDYKGLSNFAQNIYNSIKNTKLETKSDTNLSTLIKNLNSSYTDEDIDNICIELIECGAINKKGEFNKKFIQLKEFEQYFNPKIDEKYLKYAYNKNRKISENLEKKIELIAMKVSKLVVEKKKMIKKIKFTIRWKILCNL